jgi:hypothetical protein
VSDDLLGIEKIEVLRSRPAGERKYYRKVTVTHDVIVQASNEIEAATKLDAAYDWLAEAEVPNDGDTAGVKCSLDKSEGDKINETYVGDPRPELNPELEG